MKVWLLLLALLFAGCTAACAHDPGLSTTQGRFDEDRLELVVSFAPVDAQQLVTASPAQAPTSGRNWETLASQLWEVRSAGHMLALTHASKTAEAADKISFTLIYAVPPQSSITLHALRLGALPAGHRQFVSIVDQTGVVIANKLITAADNELEVIRPHAGALSDPIRAGAENSSATPTFYGFLALGVRHIWTGYDHLLFLFALLITCRSFRSIVTIITCFTVAHSLTLALATLNVVNLPSRVVEPAIAASIIFVGVENLWRRGAEPKGRGLLTFTFGLIHGFGFASVLRELGVGQNGKGLLMPLFTFNAGVEIGQIAVAAIILPIVWRLRRREEFLRWGIPILSAMVSVAGAYWLLERTVFAS